MLTICIILIVLLALDLLFTLALRCRKGHQKWEILKKYRYAHRGYHDKPVIPENSLPAFRRAIERGFGAELDVHLLKDGTLAVFHDSDLRRCANVEGEIEDLTLDELKQLRLEGTDEQIPTFDEVLALFEHATPLIIELKTARGNHKALAKAVCERLDSYQGEFCIESFDPFALIDVKKFRPAICRGQLSMNFEKDKSGLPWYKRFIAGNLLLNFLTVPDFIAYKFEDRSSYCLRSCVRVWGAQEVNWTIRKKRICSPAKPPTASPFSSASTRRAECPYIRQVKKLPPGRAAVPVFRAAASDGTLQTQPAMRCSTGKAQ